jgi:hypothetical protein
MGNRGEVKTNNGHHLAVLSAYVSLTSYYYADEFM